MDIEGHSRTIALLFDIDGTLIDSGGAGGGALLDALKQEFNLAQVHSVEFHGRTDWGIIMELLERNGVPATSENRRLLCERYFRTLPSVLRERAGRVLPGVRPLLQQLAELQSCHLGLLTGNMPISARAKLEHYRLWDFFAFGIYGDQAAHRPQLSTPALSAVRRHVAGELPAEQMVVVGDTPLDVELAQAMGARCLAVETGGFAAAELEAAGAQRVVPDLEDTALILKWCLEPLGEPA